MRRTDIPTGSAPFSLWGDYSTSGQNLILREESDAFGPEKVSYVYSALTACSIVEMESLAEGRAVIKDWMVVEIG